MNTWLLPTEGSLEQGIPVIAGAFTPTEVYNAWSAGAAMVKVFPCGFVGPSYIKELKGPFDHIPLLAVGGVNRENLADYLKAGAAGVGVSSALFGAKALVEKDIKPAPKNVKASGLTEDIRELWGGEAEEHWTKPAGGSMIKEWAFCATPFESKSYGQYTTWMVPPPAGSAPTPTGVMLWKPPP